MGMIAIDAVYQDGIIKPLEPLALQEDERVKLHIFRQTETTLSELPASDFAGLRGIWAGLGDPTYEEIKSITHQIAEERLTSLLADFDENDE
jgi:predicted DNA-binding antitoxin AbrB/MazE fold protein